MSRSIWIVNRIGWEYDDSTYYRSESGGGQPYHAYTDFEIAKSFLGQLEGDSFRTEGAYIFDYVSVENIKYRYSDENDYAEMIEAAKKVGLWYNGYEFKFIKEPYSYSDEEAKEILNFLEVEFFTLVEVELVA